ncbi:MAG: 23S rRNA (adenine(2503)-C(2))-methyltransferase RlmN [Prevotellaceae bacterium]|jgi:23S rRNA (adenine2503-C2)-methyltransferase|nr:23S rRNA (adenine(2503)-C(2))-methyltransferase RlmN [Prevotellaceae bacterium]
MHKNILLGKTINELKRSVLKLGMPAFTANQIAEWLYKKRAVSFNEMTNISLKNRNLLAENFETGLNSPVKFQESKDGTKKYLFQTPENQFVEAVYIPDDERATICVSSQAGCKMGCRFCMTGKMGFSANLSVADILNQVMSIPESSKLTNIVFMGMGEPFDNLDNLLNSIEILTADYGLAMSPRRITVSTVGMVSEMKKFAESASCRLAVSLHSPFPRERLALMPAEKAFPMQKIFEEFRTREFSRHSRLAFEYIMFANLNDDLQHAAALTKLLNGLPCRVNLIKFHAIPNVDLRPADEQKMLDFQTFLNNKGIICTIRRSRGEDIFAACGMLSTRVRKKISR